MHSMGSVVRYATSRSDGVRIPDNDHNAAYSCTVSRNGVCALHHMRSVRRCSG